jgi:hypothetical protein
LVEVQDMLGRGFGWVRGQFGLGKCIWGLGWGFWWMRGQFGSGSRGVGVEKGFWVDEGLIWLRVKRCGAWDGVLGG